jgi:hypothetical protein
MVCWIGGRRMYLWRAVDDEGGVLPQLHAWCPIECGLQV